MMKTGLNSKRDIYHIYELEAHDLNVGKSDFFWKNILQIFGAFVFMTFIVFFMINFRFISSQIADWYGARDYSIATDFSSDVSSSSVEYLISGIDQDGDGLTDKMEKFIGTEVGMMDSDEDSYDDLTEISSGDNPLGVGKLNAEIEFSGKDSLLVSWQNNLNLSENLAFKKDKKKNIFNSSFIVPLEYIKSELDDQEVKMSFYINDQKILVYYKEKTREISSSFSEISEFNKGIQLISGWPEGTDWQKLIVNLELVRVGVDN